MSGSNEKSRADTAYGSVEELSPPRTAVLVKKGGGKQFKANCYNSATATAATAATAAAAAAAATTTTYLSPGTNTGTLTVLPRLFVDEKM